MPYREPAGCYVGRAGANNAGDILLKDRLSGDVTRVSVSITGAESNGSNSWPSLNSDGRFIAFMSAGSNLAAGGSNGVADVFVRYRTTGTTERVSLGPTGQELIGGSQLARLNGIRQIRGIRSRGRGPSSWRS